MPSSLDEIEYYDNEDKDVYRLDIKAEDVECTIHPTDDFTFVDREELRYGLTVRDSTSEEEKMIIEEHIAGLSEEELPHIYEYNYPDRNNGKCSFRFTSAT